jgi:hypothetical protein
MLLIEFAQVSPVTQPAASWFAAQQAGILEGP